MAITTISSKGWVVIPAEMRKEHNLLPGTKVVLVDYGGVITIIPAMDDPVKEAAGRFKGKRSLTKALLEERKRERQREK